jgi:hypothetical protein
MLQKVVAKKLNNHVYKQSTHLEEQGGRWRTGGRSWTQINRVCVALQEGLIEGQCGDMFEEARRLSRKGF